jgi:hypothetical protein
MEGRLLAKKWLALRDVNPREISPYAIHGGKVYQLVEDLEEEVWRLRIIDLR